MEEIPLLIPAAVYKDDIQKLSKQFFYSDKAFYYNGCPMTAPINVADEDEYGELFQYAIINKDILVGYLSYRIRWYDSCAYAFGLFGFQDKPNPVPITFWSGCKMQSIYVYKF